MNKTQKEIQRLERTLCASELELLSHMRGLSCWAVCETIIVYLQLPDCAAGVWKKLIDVLVHKNRL